MLTLKNKDKMTGLSCQNPEIDIHVFVQLVVNKDRKTFQCENIVFITTGLKKNIHSYPKRNGTLDI